MNHSTATDTSALVDDETWNALVALLFPYYESRKAAVLRNGNRFAYYTSAAVAKAILTEKRIWLRNALMMNDFREIDHGMACLERSWGDKRATHSERRCKSVIPSCPGEWRRGLLRCGPP